MSDQSSIPDGEIVESAGVLTLDTGDELVYEIRGQGPAVVLIHGWSCRRADWTQIAERVSQDFTVIALDLPGHGTARGTRVWSVSEFGGLVAQLVRQLQLRGVVLIGHSMGGAVAVEAARNLGSYCRGVVAVDSLTYLSIYPRQEDSTFMPGVEAIAQDFAGSMVGLVQGLSGPATSADLNEVIAAEMAEANPEFAVPLLVDLYRWDLDSALQDLACPLTIIAAQAHLSPEASQKFQENADLWVVDFGGHFFLREDPQATAQVLLEVLQDFA